MISKGKKGILRKLNAVIRHAKDFHDGHFFILGFTSEYKGGFGTPDLDTGEGRGEVLKMTGCKNVEELLNAMLTPSCGCIRLKPKPEKHE